MRIHTLRTAIAGAVLTLGAAAAHAQSSGNGYLFRQPEFRVTVRGGYSLAAANSDIFDFSTQHLTLNKRDFGGFTAGAELSWAVSNRFEISADVGMVHSSRQSEFRDFVDNNDLPIEQTTTFERVPMMMNLRYFLSSPGRSVGKLAWIPARATPWVGVGGGAMYYKFDQHGDFVDFTNNNVFRANLETEGWTPAAQAMGGVEFSLTPMLSLTTDARYVWGKAPVSYDFSDFNRIDLSGVSATIGLTFRR